MHWFERFTRAFLLCPLLASIITIASPRAEGAGSPVTPGAVPLVVYSASRYFEGPTWDPATRRLYFTQLTGEMRILSLNEPNSVSVWMANTQAINGTYLSNDGRLLGAQGNTKRILSYRIGASGPEDLQILAQNSAWKAPNDLCQSPTGDVYFTCPDFDTKSAGRVYRIAPGGAVTTVITDMPVPNGIITSLDGRTLYVSDSQLRYWKTYPILTDGSVGAGSIFFNPSTPDSREPDGMSIDEFGNLAFCGRGGVWFVTPAGEMLDFVPITEFAANVTFGGIDGHTLYITCDQKVYALDMRVRGAAWRGKPDPNQPPHVNAGNDRILASTNRTTTLTGQITNDGLPQPATMTIKWSLVSGPTAPAIATPSAVLTNVTFAQVGTYVFRLSAFDGSRYATDEVTISVAKPADFDADNDVDISDTNLFVPCLTGVNAGPPASGCESMDLDLDGDVDNSDFGLLQRCLSGPFTASDPNCVP